MTVPIADPKERFSDRVDNYVKYRPGYPPGVIDLLRVECGLGADVVVADVGSGTGILTELLLNAGASVYGIEPNREMREAGERLLASYPGFTSVAASAEETTLPEASVDLITAGQAFHWFDRVRTRDEFRRILKTTGWCALIWNDRLTDATPFLIEYEQMLRDYSSDYKVVNHRELDLAEIKRFYGPEGYALKTFENRQLFDFEGLKGRLLSSSYSPAPGHPNHELILQKLRQIFDRHNEGGKVAFDYQTLVYHGRLE